MNSEIFSVFDSAADRFLDIFSQVTVEAAIRDFKQACMKEGHQFAKFPEDYALYHVGTWQPELGELVPMKARKIAMATSFTSGYGNQLDIESLRNAEPIREETDA